VLIAWFILCAVVYWSRGRMASIREALALIAGALIVVGLTVVLRRMLRRLPRPDVTA
jgi:hypothetical protein